MRICLYTSTALPMVGGQEMVVDALAREFQSLGHDPLVIAPRPKSSYELEDQNFPYPVLRHPRFISTRFFVPWYKRYLLRAYRFQPFDILHCHGLYPAAYLGALTRPYCNVPLVVTCHGGDAYLENPRLNKRGWRDRIRFGLEQADACVAISAFTRFGMNALGPGIRSMVDIPNGVDTVKWVKPASKPHGCPQEIQPKKWILFLGRLTQRKGVDTLLRALACLPAHDRLPLVVAGSGEEEKNWKKLVQDFHLQSSVYFVGNVSEEVKAYYLQNALITMVPSRTWEAFGLVLLESASAGTPVFASKLPGLQELILPGRTGELFEPESHESLARLLKIAKQHPRRMMQMGMEAQSWAQDYSWRKVALQHLAMYQEVSKGLVRKAG